ncbi:MAG: EamA family transporter [Chloroflexi bacterium HGW-Chloroflexi-10]|nr:MAG: EamA family transporter [Chloroflexi bacterium HGW-Chloroflexi-10]
MITTNATVSQRTTATLLALAAILIWSSLAVFGATMKSMPPFLLLGVTLLLSGSVSLVRRRAWRVPLITLLVGVGGIFGYHFLYFRAFALAPAVEANLINYLWPLLIVVLSPLFLGYRLHAQHILGALLGLAGAALIVSGGRFSLQFAYLPGYLLAFGAAVTWSVYSLLTKRLPPFETDAVAAFCAVSGALSLLLYFFTGGSLVTIQALTAKDWLLLVLIGAGPMGAAFFFWDAALKRGDPRMIGSLAYLTPLLSTINLALFAGQHLNMVSLAAMGLIIGGAVLGSGNKQG